MFGILLLAIKGLLVLNLSKGTMNVSKFMIRFLLLLLTLSPFLAMVRYTWYTQPPHLSPHDIIVANILNDKIDANSNFNIFSKNAFTVYYCSRSCGSPFTHCMSPIFLAYESSLTIEKYDLILWDQILSFELSKYVESELRLNTLLHQGDALMNTDGSILLRNPLRR